MGAALFETKCTGITLKNIFFLWGRHVLLYDNIYAFFVTTCSYIFYEQELMIFYITYSALDNR